MTASILELGTMIVWSAGSLFAANKQGAAESDYPLTWNTKPYLD